MARVRSTFVDVDAFAVVGWPESGSALTGGFAVLDLAQSIVAFQRFARVDALERLLVASAILRTVFVLDTFHSEAAKFDVVGVAPGGRWAATRWLMVDYRTDGVGSARRGATRIRASFGSSLAHQTGQVVAASGARFALVGSDTRFSVSITDSSLSAGATERSGCVGTLSSGVAWFALALVDIDASTGRSWSVSRGASTLAVAARLAVGTVGVRSTSRPASAIDTDFSGHAVVVAVADLDASARKTAFSSDASVGTFATGRVASSSLAGHSSWASISSLAVSRIPQASLLGSWSTHKSCVSN